jgi:Phage major capsid protein E
MPTVRSLEKPFELVDYTEELNLIPNTWGLINELGVFRSESVAQHSITIESKAGTLGVITDQVRGARNLVNKDEVSALRSFAIPHFPLDDYISPQDLQGKRAYGTSDTAETEAAVIARKLARIRMNHAVTMETARAFAITNGAVYAPNGTVVGNYYTDFGVTRKEVDFVLGTTATDVIAKAEEVIAHIQDNILSGESVTSVVALCSPVFFGKLIAQAGIKEAYKFYTSTQEPLRKRLGSGLFRRFEHGGVEFVEYRGTYNGTALIPTGDAYFLPRGTADMFISYFSPANKFSHVNTLGEEAYAFTYRDSKDEKIEMQTEHNALHLIRRPAAVVRGFSSN